MSVWRRIAVWTGIAVGCAVGLGCGGGTAPSEAVRGQVGGALCEGLPPECCQTPGLCENLCNELYNPTCDDGNPCTEDWCEPTRYPMVGVCHHTPVAGCCTSSADCGGDACTTYWCLFGTCKVALSNPGCCSSNAACDDGNPCTTDACVGGKWCSHDPVASPVVCDDGDPCTSQSYCIKGQCTAITLPGQGPNCDDGNPCTADTCISGLGCAHFTPVGLPCDDGNACTSGDHCTGGACVGSTVDCDDGNPCTADTCLPETGCLHGPVKTPTPCDDGLSCTGPDTCVGAACEGPPQCDDANPCTVDTCTAQGCTHGPVECDDADPATPDACDPSLGCVHSAAECDDGDPCTIDEVEVGVGCAHVPLACDDGDPCTVDACDPAAGGCVHAPAYVEAGPPCLGAAGPVGDACCPALVGPVQACSPGFNPLCLEFPAVEYVDDDADPALADGSLAHPWTTIGAGVAAAATGAAVCVAPGTYPELVTITRSVHVIGACPDATRVVGGGFAISGADGVTLRMLSVHEGAPCVDVYAATHVGLWEVALLRCAVAGLQVTQATLPPPAALPSLCDQGLMHNVEMCQGRVAFGVDGAAGVFTDLVDDVFVSTSIFSHNTGAALYLRRDAAVVRSSRIEDGALGVGIEDPREDTTIEHNDIVSNAHGGVLAAQRQAVPAAAVEVAVLANHFASNGGDATVGTLNMAPSPAALSARVEDNVVLDAAHTGVLIVRSPAHVEGNAIVDVSSPDAFGAGRGIEVQRAPSFDVRANAVVSSAGAGVFVVVAGLEEPSRVAGNHVVGAGAYGVALQGVLAAENACNAPASLSALPIEVTGNVVLGAAGTGLHVESVPAAVVVTHNELRPSSSLVAPFFATGYLVGASLCATAFRAAFNVFDAASPPAAAQVLVSNAQPLTTGIASTVGPGNAYGGGTPLATHAPAGSLEVLDPAVTPTPADPASIPMPCPLHPQDPLAPANGLDAVAP